MDSSQKKTELPSEEEVTRYLRNHPGFFLANEDLLVDLKLSHKTGKAVSLLERQVALLRERNMDMRNRLSKLLDNAQRNEQLFEQSKALILSLLEAKRADELSNTLCRHLVSDFEPVDYASLILFADPNKLGGSQLRVENPEQAREHIGGLLGSHKAVCGVLRPQELGFLFGKHADHIGSAAIMPIKPGNIDGVIAIASKDPEHFKSSMGTLFLDYIVEVVNRSLPKLMRSPFG
ncbi:hypothetical protein IMCC21906_00179 [Spongiibacter sp. IMCC21906]|uniref:DUF484 family protein n=1 Tax=Spongiibacter sp. IMCC21906 TaxID=1620392 RepID=UPI00062DE7DF|nr:DUF484 family protein [Spongiibacter sp. IMCC21906]AKH67873.1 hypothetical protein IMCC21906_00179 [Spongiibacter sp. IMCC21906]